MCYAAAAAVVVVVVVVVDVDDVLQMVYLTLPEARDQYTRRHRFLRELVDFCGGKRTQRKPLGVGLRSTNLSPRTSAGHSGGRRKL